MRFDAGKYNGAKDRKARFPFVDQREYNDTERFSTVNASIVDFRQRARLSQT